MNDIYKFAEKCIAGLRHPKKEKPLSNIVRRFWCFLLTVQMISVKIFRV